MDAEVDVDESDGEDPAAGPEVNEEEEEAPSEGEAEDLAETADLGPVLSRRRLPLRVLEIICVTMTGIRAGE